MAVEIACGNCGNTFGVEAEWANLIVQCPFCSTAVQVPAEVAQWADAAATGPQSSVHESGPAPEPPAGSPAVSLGGGQAAGAIDWQAIAPAASATKSQAPDFSHLTPAAIAPPPPVPASTPTPVPTPTPTSVPTSTPARTSPRTPPRPSTPASAAVQAPRATPKAPPPPTPTLAPTSAPAPALPVSPALPLPPWSVPPACPWLVDNGLDSLRVVVNEGTTAIRYQGQRVVLRAEPAATRWYGLSSFVLSILTLVVLLTWLYFVYR